MADERKGQAIPDLDSFLPLLGVPRGFDSVERESRGERLPDPVGLERIHVGAGRPLLPQLRKRGSAATHNLIFREPTLQ